MSNPPSFYVQFHPRGYLAVGGKVSQSQDSTAFFRTKNEAIAAVRCSAYAVLFWSVRCLESAEKQEVEA